MTRQWCRCVGYLAYERAAYPLHPALLDACMQTLGARFAHLASTSEAWLPVAIGEFSIHHTHVDRVWCHVEAASTLDNASLSIYDDSGWLVARFSGLQLRRTRPEALLQRRALPRDWTYTRTWEPVPRSGYVPTADRGGRWIIVGDSNDLARALNEQLNSADAEAEVRGVIFLDGLLTDYCSRDDTPS